ncbi:MAG: hypothetical protein L3J21_04285 [Devosiaceae bacterium]|nr:hypothetical protein [Devosiaceae bacterium]
MIEPPKENPPQRSIRVLMEALAQFTPVTAGLAHIYQFAYPSDMEAKLAVWRTEISNLSNTHEARICQLEEKITPLLRISKTALELALWLTKTSNDGLCSTATEFNDLQADFMEIDEGKLQEACYELKHLELVELVATLDSPIYLLYPTYKLFWALDLYIIGNDPNKDAVEIAKLMVNDKSFGDIQKLDNKLKWPNRRLNPAIARIIPLITDSHVSKEKQNTYPTKYFNIGPEDQFKLKRFINETVVPESTNHP